MKPQARAICRGNIWHGAVLTWLNGGVPPVEVAVWAGHSVEVLLKIYAKCLDGSTDVLRRRIEGL
ncbi:MAG: hypothetical protein H0T78_05420 [Longispora sp.]|nr:hypothetical protein [Longispora sp. (in: high G+C Gram-positive bacteria)]